jgi:hypothetical protein
MTFAAVIRMINLSVCSKKNELFTLYLKNLAIDASKTKQEKTFSFKLESIQIDN